MALFGGKADAKPETRSIDTVIGAEATFEGVLRTKNSVCIEGTFRGTLEGEAAVIVGRSACVEAEISAEYISVNGAVRGNVRASRQLDVGESGAIYGEVTAAAVTVAKGGVLEGSCRMSETGTRGTGEALSQGVCSDAPPVTLLQRRAQRGEAEVESGKGTASAAG